MEENPYAPPETKDPNESSALRIRQHYEKQELAIKLIGCSFLLFGLLLLYQTSAPISNFHNGFISTRSIVFSIIGAAVLLFIVAIGYGLLTLRKSARRGAVLWCFLMIFGFPYGTAISFYFIYILFGPKTDFILSPLYRDAINKTPDYRLSFKKSHWGIYLTNLIIFGVIIGFISLKAS